MAAQANTFLLVTILFLVTVLLIFAMKYFSAARQARARLSEEGGYRELSEKATAGLAAVQAELAEIRARLASVEKMLKEVE